MNPIPLITTTLRKKIGMAPTHIYHHTPKENTKTHLPHQPTPYQHQHPHPLFPNHTLILLIILHMSNPTLIGGRTRMEGWALRYTVEGEPEGWEVHIAIYDAATRGRFMSADLMNVWECLGCRLVANVWFLIIWLALCKIFVDCTQEICRLGYIVCQHESSLDLQKLAQI